MQTTWNRLNGRAPPLPTLRWLLLLLPLLLAVSFPKPASALDPSELKFTNKAVETYNGCQRAALTAGQSSFGPASLAAYIFGENPKGREDTLGNKICKHANADKVRTELGAVRCHC